MSATDDANAEAAVREEPFTNKTEARPAYTVGEIVDLTTTNHVVASIGRAFYVNVDGLVKFTPSGKSTDVAIYCVKGVEYPWRVRKFVRTGTDAGLQNATSIVVAK